ncbi:MAG: Gfo/Idh/MocA family oxidoreductase [Treponema sp.]|nr:Gfo/Idh/MocA family oxidoreductase [Treponema sp.]
MKWGIIATGTIAKKFARTLNEMKGEGESLVAVASRNLEKAQAFAAEFGAEKAFGSYEELASFEGIDAVYIATPNNLHYENTKLCLSHSKNVLCEKPFTLCENEGKELYEIAEKSGLFLMEGFWISFLPLYKDLLKKIQSNEFGALRHARCDFGFVAQGERRERKFKAELGGGALLDIGIYNLGFLQMIMGSSPISFTSAVTMNEFGTDAFSCLQLSYPQGKSAQCSQAIGLVMARKAALYFDEASIYLDDFQNATSYIVERPGQESQNFSFPFDINGFEYQIREFSQCVKEGKTHSSIHTPQKSMELLALMDKIRSDWKMEFPKS